MASHTSRNQEIERLIRLAEQSRGQLGGKIHQLRRQLDVPARMKASVFRHPSLWMAGSMFSGLAASSLFRRRRPAEPKKKKGLAALLLGLTLTAAKPAAKIWLANRAKDWMAGRSFQSRTPRIPS